MAVPHQSEEGKSASKDVGPEGGWIVMSHIGWEGEQNTIYKGVETFPSFQSLQSLEGTRWTPKGVDCDVPHWLERRTKHHL